MLDLLLESMHLHIQTHELLVYCQRLLLVSTAFIGITQGQISVYVLCIFLDRKFKLLNRTGVVTLDVVQNSRVVHDHTVFWIELDRFLVVPECFCQLARPFKVDSKVLVDFRVPRVGLECF